MKMMLELMYIACGIVLIVSGLYSFKLVEGNKKYTTALFWIIFGSIFIVGPYVNPVIVGVLILVMSGLSLTKSIKMGKFFDGEPEVKQKQSEKIGNKIFIPALTIGVVAVLIAQFTKLGGLIGIGIGSVVALALTLAITKESVDKVPYDSTRLLQSMGATVMLPQLLGALGSVFTAAGVGAVISNATRNIIPDNNLFIAVAVYCISMALFTMIMGNAFAAFAVITSGIGYPFLIATGGNPAVIGLLGLTSGYCGTLLTPMGANFNIVPASILEMKNKNGVILKQVGVAVPMLAIHIILMYVLAF